MKENQIFVSLDNSVGHTLVQLIKFWINCQISLYPDAPTALVQYSNVIKITRETR